MSRHIFTIHVGERHCRREEQGQFVEWYHSFLALSHEIDSSQPDPKDHVISQIHFVPDDLGYILPEHKPRTTLTPVITGDAAHITNCWNRMGEFAQGLEETAILFGPNSRFEPTSINCRTGIRETMKAGGLELHTEFTKSMAGMAAHSFFIGRRFEHLPAISRKPV
jgi:hypothetical protein